MTIYRVGDRVRRAHRHASRDVGQVVVIGDSAYPLIVRWTTGDEWAYGLDEVEFAEENPHAVVLDKMATEWRRSADRQLIEGRLEGAETADQTADIIQQKADKIRWQPANNEEDLNFEV